eukprot:Nitzschia sp. Nitz4//scaffold129_size63868//31071//34237//NITZ4_006199-RA/size63868-augustus-gene-0.56-mRNA-1//-1//CDS//3329534905//1230//frame0
MSGRGGRSGRSGGRGGGGGRSHGRGGQGRGPGGGGGRGGGRGGRGGRGGPDLSQMQSALSNIILATVTQGFQFYLYSVQATDVNGDPIESLFRRRFLFNLGFWDGLLKDMPDKEKKDLRRVVFFLGSFFFSARPIEALENLPVALPVGGQADGDSIHIVKMEHYLPPKELKVPVSAPSQRDQIAFDQRCAGCAKAFVDVGSLLQHCQQVGHRPVYMPGDTDTSKVVAHPAQLEVFVAYVNQVLQQALGERLAKWGPHFIDPQSVKEPVDRQGRSLGVQVYEAFSCKFGLLRNPQGVASLALTVDLRAKVIRSVSVLDYLCDGSDPKRYKPSPQDIARAKKDLIGEIVIAKYDKKCYTVTDVLFNHSPATMPVEGLGMSHAQYFEKRKSIKLKYPSAAPMLAVMGRKDQTIYLPAELVCKNELDSSVKEQLPMIASFTPPTRNDAIDKIRAYLIPGAQTSKGAGGLLPAVGVQLLGGRLGVKAQVLPLPQIMAAGVPVPKHRGENWAPVLSKADFNVNPKRATTMNVVLVFHKKLNQSARQVYQRVRDFVNGYNSSYRFSVSPVEFVEAGDNEQHWGAVERCLSNPKFRRENVFVVDFCKPARGSSDTAYPVIKKLLTQNGYLSQFVNFKTYAHDNPRDFRKSDMILQGVARQIVQKTGTRLWWVKIPPSVPTPSVFVGVDVFHAPRVYDPKTKKRSAKASCAAIIVQVYRGQNDHRTAVELYSETHARAPGKEYDLGDALKATVGNALRELKVEPKSCIVWRDGIGDSAFDMQAQEEIRGIRDGLGQGVVGQAGKKDIPLSYLVCQKRIDTKFLSKGVPNEPDGKYGAPSGTLVKGVQGIEHDTFYINGRAPPYSTPKPVRFVVVKKDDKIQKVDLPALTWDMCHDYPNWVSFVKAAIVHCASRFSLTMRFLFALLQTGPIKVPSVCQMAHKLAELAGGFTDCGASIDSRRLKNTVHFL